MWFSPNHNSGSRYLRVTSWATFYIFLPHAKRFAQHRLVRRSALPGPVDPSKAPGREGHWVGEAFPLRCFSLEVVPPRVPRVAWASSIPLGPQTDVYISLPSMCRCVHDIRVEVSAETR